jgi:hypothetical protein
MRAVLVDKQVAKKTHAGLAFEVSLDLGVKGALSERTSVAGFLSP